MALIVFKNAHGKLRNIWWVVIFFLILASLLFPLIFISKQYNFEISLTYQGIIILVTSVICQLLSRNPIYNLVGKLNFTWFKELIFGLLVGAFLMGMPALILTAFGFVSWQTSSFSYSTIVSGLTLFVAVALVEELLFRGFIFQRLIDAFGQWPAQLVIAGLFLLTHLNNPGMTGITKVLASVNIFIASLMFGIAYIKTKKLAMPLGLHIMANYMQGTILGFGVSGEQETSLFKPVFNQANIWLTGGQFGLEASVLGLLSVFFITILFYKDYLNKIFPKRSLQSFDNS